MTSVQLIIEENLIFKVYIVTLISKQNAYK